MVRESDFSTGETVLGLPETGLSRRSTGVLMRVVEQHIVPRLVLSHPHAVAPVGRKPRVAERIPDMTSMALGSDDNGSQHMLSSLHAEGATHDQLQLGLIAPVAERLGTLWREDEIDFLDVTIGTNSLMRSMRFVSLELDRLSMVAPHSTAILVATSPGETHVFGAAMAAEFFRRAGWHVSHPGTPTRDEIVAEVRGQRFDVVGLSLTHARGLEALASTIDGIRAHSVNPDIVVIVGGAVFAHDPELVGKVGADAAIAAVEMAPAKARDLVATKAGTTR